MKAGDRCMLSDWAMATAFGRRFGRRRGTIVKAKKHGDNLGIDYYLVRWDGRKTASHWYDQWLCPENLTIIAQGMTRKGSATEAVQLGDVL